MKDVPRHQCLIYAGKPSEQLARLAASIHAHLKQNYRCLYLNDPSMVDGVRSYLMASGLNVSEAVFTKRLVFLSDRSHLRDGIFDFQYMIDELEAAHRKSLEDGYVGLWASGDMGWEFGPAKDFSKLIQYERALENLFGKHPTLRGVCQYHEDVLPGGIAKLARELHPAIYVNETLSKISAEYVPA